MHKNYFELTNKEKLDIIGHIVDQLVKTADACFNLSEKEKCDIVEGAFSGIHKIMDNRYSRLKNKYSVKEK
jgi:hypothetical protein